MWTLRKPRHDPSHPTDKAKGPQMTISEQLDAIEKRAEAATTIDPDKVIRDWEGNLVSAQEQCINELVADVPKLVAALRRALKSLAIYEGIESNRALADIERILASQEGAKP